MVEGRKSEAKSPMPGLLVGIAWLVFLCPACVALGAPTDQPPGDDWVSSAVQYPTGCSSNQVCRCSFESLHAEVVAEQFRIVWLPPSNRTNDEVTVVVSADALGHWPARDWRTYPMEARGASRSALVPVDSLHVPLVYFVRAATATETNLSQMRRCDPFRMDLDAPTRIFWSFLEGFEEQLESWRLLSENVPALRADGPARSGRRALAVTVPRGKRSVTVGTTRLRGWFALEHGATGVSLSLRTRAGMGRVRFTLLANAYGPGQAISPSTVEAAIRAEWQRIDLPFSSFPRLDLAEVDLFALEFLGEGPLEFLVDDLQLLGPWRYE